MPKASRTTIFIQKANHWRLPPATAATAPSAAAKAMSTCESWGNPTPNISYDLEWEGPARANVSSTSSRAAGRNSQSFVSDVRFLQALPLRRCGKDDRIATDVSVRTISSAYQPGLPRRLQGGDRPRHARMGESRQWSSSARWNPPKLRAYPSISKADACK
ncbi:hypothetical protein OBBRIDRAFT_653551 [Obba rivulosa]|uniref:Uncharacterized protein n=1 Tax=Obba rivulosa TaxID=1052685 RepID=A0A8E2DNF2_9APHY|nr:hypothetical protein OBBRIDRAFT_653551 [Obba rivulosa]